MFKVGEIVKIHWYDFTGRKAVIREITERSCWISLLSGERFDSIGRIGGISRNDGREYLFDKEYLKKIEKKEIKQFPFVRWCKKYYV